VKETRGVIFLAWLMSGCADAPAPPPENEDPTVPEDTGGDEPDVVVSTFTVSVDTARAVKDSFVQVPVTVDRSQGYSGPLVVTVTGLPMGTTAKPLTIDEGELTGEVTLRTILGATLGGPFALTWTTTPVEGDAVETTSVLWVADRSGQRDITFGTMGTVDLGGPYPLDFDVDEQGRPVVVGRNELFSGPTGFVLRLLLDGSPDPDFGDDGLISDPSLGSEAPLVAVRPGGRPLVLSRRTVVSQEFWSLHSFTADGQPDETGFFYDGKIPVADADSPWRPQNLVLRPDEGSYVVFVHDVYSFEPTGQPVTPATDWVLPSERLLPSAADVSGKLLLGSISLPDYAIHRFTSDRMSGRRGKSVDSGRSILSFKDDLGRTLENVDLERLDSADPGCDLAACRRLHHRS